LVRDKKIAAFAGSFSNFPGSKYPNLWMAFVIPSPGVGNDEVQAAVREEIERLKSGEITDAEMRRFRTRAKADLIRQLGNNSGIAFQLSMNQTLHGDWRALFRQIEAIEGVTREDIRRVAQETFVPSNRTVATIRTEAPAKNQETSGDAGDES
jgi:predicted Zn-dependent peptidase